MTPVLAALLLAVGWASHAAWHHRVHRRAQRIRNAGLGLRLRGGR